MSQNLQNEATRQLVCIPMGSSSLGLPGICIIPTFGPEDINRTYFGLLGAAGVCTEVPGPPKYPKTMAQIPHVPILLGLEVHYVGVGKTRGPNVDPN